MSAMKEPAYFTFAGGPPAFQGPGDLEFKVVTDWQQYRSLFEGASGFRAVGEASTQYISGGATVAARIDAACPDVRLMAVLRHPAERAYAHYNHWVRRGVEREPTFEAAMSREAERQEKNYLFWWAYRQQGFYAEQLRPYYERFGPARVKVLLYEDLIKKPHELLREVFQFLDVDADFRVDISKKHNVGSVPKSRLLHNLLVRNNPLKSVAKKVVPTPLRRWVTPRLMRNNSERPAKLNPATRAALIDAYRDDILALQGLAGRDLSAWLAT